MFAIRSRLPAALISGISGIAFGALLLSGCTADTREAAPAPPPPTATVTVVQPAAPAVGTSRKPAPKPANPARPDETGMVLGRDAYGSFTLGMSKDAALATGQLAGRHNDGTGCRSYTMTSGGTVVISDRLGVARIEGSQSARTPEGIRAGSTVAQVQAKYPTATAYRAGLSTAVPGTTNAIYEFLTTGSQPDNKVEAIRITLVAYDCALAL